MNLTLQYDQVMFILEPNEITRALARKRVTVLIIPMAGWRSATAAWIWRIGLSINGRR